MDELIETSGSAARLKVLPEESGRSVVKIVGEMDLSSVGAVRQALEPILALRPDCVVFDMSELSFMDSSGLSMLLAVAGQVDVLRLRNPSSQVRKIVELTGLAKVLPIDG